MVRGSMVARGSDQPLSLSPHWFNGLDSTFLSLQVWWAGSTVAEVAVGLTMADLTEVAASMVDDGACGLFLYTGTEEDDEIYLFIIIVKFFTK